MPTSETYVPQVGGTHYAAEYQHWDFVADAGLGYFEGQITKYVGRWRKKNGLEDLRKALTYAQKYIKVMGERFVHRVAYSGSADVVSFSKVEQALNRYVKANPHLGEAERRITALVAHSHDAATVTLVAGVLKELIAEAEAGATPAYINQGGK